MKYLAFICIGLLTAPVLNAQFFSGAYQSEPEIPGFEHVVIKHHHNKTDKYHGDLTVSALTSNDFEMWKSPAKMISGEKASFFIKTFGEDRDVKTVYEVKVEVDGIEEDFILLGYINAKGHGAFLGVEEVFSNNTETKLLELKKFHLVRRHR